MDGLAAAPLALSTVAAAGVAALVAGLAAAPLALSTVAAAGVAALVAGLAGYWNALFR